MILRFLREFCHNIPQFYLLNLIHESRHGSLRNESKEDDVWPVDCGANEHNSRVCNLRGRQSVAYATPAGTKALHGLRTCPTGTQHAIRFRYWCHRDRLPGLGAKEDETDVAKTHRQSGPLDAVPGYLSRSHNENFHRQGPRQIRRASVCNRINPTPTASLEHQPRDYKSPAGPGG